MQPRPVNEENKAIVAFLTHFNYLGDDKKRAGFSMFNNKVLTRQLESTSRGLISDLNDLMADGEISAGRNGRFLKIVQRVIEHVRVQRGVMAPVKNTFEKINILGRHDGGKVDVDYKIPYPNGKFEKNLVKGLTAAKVFLNDAEKIICDQLVNSINNFVPEQIIVEDRSCVP